MTAIETKLIEKFLEFKESLNGESSHPSFDLRQNSMNKFKTSGIPTRKHEEWRYTPLSFLNKYEFTPTIEKKNSLISSNDVNEFLFNNINENLIVFINGFYCKHLSRIITEVKNGLYIGSINDAIEAKVVFTEELGALSSKSDDPMVNLNNAFFRDGALIIAPENYELNETIHILSICDSSLDSPFVNIKNIVKAGINSKLKIVETCHLYGNSPAVQNSTTEIYSDRDSTLHYYKFQNDGGELFNLGHTLIDQKENSVLHSTAITLKSKFVRNTLETRFKGEHCESNMDGFYFVDNKDFVDNHTVVIHGKPNCQSNETYRGILDDKSIAVFNGKVIVEQDAQKTVAYQSNKNILLSDEATINTKPQLEIFADDVKCSHGATTGSLDEKSLFYLRARGVSEEKAKSLLLNAFSAELIDNILIPELRDNIRENIGKRLGIEDIFLCHAIDKKKHSNE